MAKEKKEVLFMDDIIKRIVAIDRQCVTKVENAKLKKANAKVNASAIRQEVYESMIKSQQEAIQARKDVLQKQNMQAIKDVNNNYENTLKQMEETYQAKKETWVASIVERCLK